MSSYLRKKFLIASATVGINVRKFLKSHTVVHLNQGFCITTPQCPADEFFSLKIDTFHDMIFLISSISTSVIIEISGFIGINLTCPPHYTLHSHPDDLDCSSHRQARQKEYLSQNFIFFGFSTWRSFCGTRNSYTYTSDAPSYAHFYASLCSHILNILVP